MLGLFNPWLILHSHFVHPSRDGVGSAGVRKRRRGGRCLGRRRGLEKAGVRCLHLDQRLRCQPLLFLPHLVVYRLGLGGRLGALHPRVRRPGRHGAGGFLVRVEFAFQARGHGPYAGGEACESRWSMAVEDEAMGGLASS